MRIVVEEPMSSVIPVYDVRYKYLAIFDVLVYLWSSWLWKKEAGVERTHDLVEDIDIYVVEDIDIYAFHRKIIRIRSFQYYYYHWG